MIGSTKKPFENIVEALNGHTRVAVVGCDGCAKVCMTGGTDQVAEMGVKLREIGKQVVLEVTPDRTCYVQKCEVAFDPHKDALGQAEAVMVLGCGGAVQITRKVIEDYGFEVPVRTGVDSVGHMDTLVMGELALEQCRECGDCVLNETGGICPVTKCAKSLLNGPCGGAEDGKCEVDASRDCAWILIYNKLAALGELHKLRRYVEAKDQSKAAKPRVLNIKEGRVE